MAIKQTKWVKTSNSDNLPTLIKVKTEEAIKLDKLKNKYDIKKIMNDIKRDKKNIDDKA